MLLAIVFYIIQGVIFGIATNAVISNRGYDENWFWWGFFFGFIALIVACSKPENHYTSSRESIIVKPHTLSPDEWQCTCGRINPRYLSVCSCGNRKSGNAAAAPQNDAPKVSDNLDTLKKLKELLDLGAITQEEYDRKKEDLLK